MFMLKYLTPLNPNSTDQMKITPANRVVVMLLNDGGKLLQKQVFTYY